MGSHKYTRVFVQFTKDAASMRWEMWWWRESVHDNRWGQQVSLYLGAGGLRSGTPCQQVCTCMRRLHPGIAQKPSSWNPCTSWRHPKIQEVIPRCWLRQNQGNASHAVPSQCCRWRWRQKNDTIVPKRSAEADKVSQDQTWAQFHRCRVACERTLRKVRMMQRM